MISNERQLAVAQQKLQALKSTEAQVGRDDAEAYAALIKEVQREIDDYLAVRDGHVNLFPVTSVDDLSRSVIRARVARRWSQKDLAEALDVREQQVQKDEGRQYENVGLAKLADTVDVLGYQLVGTLRPTHLPVQHWRGPNEFQSQTIFGTAVRDAATAISVTTCGVWSVSATTSRFAIVGATDSFSWRGGGAGILGAVGGRVPDSGYSVDLLPVGLAASVRREVPVED